MGAKAELLLEKKAAMDAQLKLCNQANASNREFSDPERMRFEQLEGTVKSIDRQLDTKSGDDAIKDELRKMGFFNDDNTPHRSDGGPARGAWSKAFLADDQCWGRGRAPGLKQLLPSGSITVPSLSGTLTPLSDNAAVESLLSLIPVQSLEGTDQFSALVETKRVNKAAVVACADPKPESELDIERVDGRAQVIATLSPPIQRQSLDDSALLAKYVDGTLRAMVKAALENEVVNGSGVVPHLGPGLVPGAGQYLPFVLGGLLATLRSAITLLELVPIGLANAWFVFHPTDWEAVETAQDLVNNYQMGPGVGDARLPVSRSTRRLWGLPVATCLSLAPGTALLVDSGSVMLWERSQATVDWSENTFDPGLGLGDFARNLKRFRCELRAGFLVLRPMGVILIDLVPGS